MATYKLNVLIFLSTGYTLEYRNYEWPTFQILQNTYTVIYTFLQHTGYTFLHVKLQNICSNIINILLLWYRYICMLAQFQDISAMWILLL